MRINTGKGSISLLTLCAIWSVSLVVNLPGLAISPLLGNLDKIFPNTSQIEIQLLTILPNLCIIPFVLLSGKLSLTRNKISILVFALLIYLMGGILYFFAQSMIQLIIVSCILGIGCGLVIPLAAGLLADAFTGKERMKQLGIKSGIANISLVLATLAVGEMNNDNWHLPFVVYLIPIIPLALSVFLRRAAKNNPHTPPLQPQQASFAQEKLWHNRQLLSCILLYFFVTYTVSIESYYLPFLLQDYGISTSILGSATALFFLAIFIPGFTLSYIIKIFKGKTLWAAAAMISLGLLLMLLQREAWAIMVAAFLMGSGYGIFQPIIYDKAVTTVKSESKATMALAWVLASNYLAVTLTPLIIDSLRWVFDTESNLFPFLLNFILMAIATLFIVWKNNLFIFQIEKSYYNAKTLA